MILNMIDSPTENDNSWPLPTVYCLLFTAYCTEGALATNHQPLRSHANSEEIFQPRRH